MFNTITYEISFFLKDFFSNLTLEKAVHFFIIYGLIIWGSIVIWVAKDITNRTNNIIFQVLSILLVLIFTPLGIFIYFLIRPQYTLFEQYYQESCLDFLEKEEDIKEECKKLEEKEKKKKTLKKD